MHVDSETGEFRTHSMNTKRTSKPKPNSLKYRHDGEINEIQQRYASIQDSKEALNRFVNFPLSQKTLKGLADAKYIQPTAIQCDSIIPALLGKDVLGAAETGSGKTLAFLIPVLEHLFINKWSRNDGICAIIISPTRELAYQIFETLRKVGKYHDFSGGLIIGGKNLKFERTRMDQCNILICTPGRLLQHMDENPLFNATTMEMLILDEADRCLDMGFQDALNSIMENFPPTRQTLLFSATQTTSVQDLARLNLTDPVYIGIKANNEMIALPDLLQQNYVVVELQDKITMLWSFIKNHLKQKIIVFLSTCKQVKYMYEIFCKLRPGISLLALYGTLHQDRRITIYNDFLRRSNVVLFATDIASRGLDFPSVNWVVQLDCPEDVAQYIHRAGRSARNKARGESLLVLLPTEEEAMIKELTKKFIKVQHIQIDPKKLFSPRVKMEAFLAQNSELKASAQRAFAAYMKSVFVMKNKNVFNIFKLDMDAFAKSLGLALTPRVPFLERIMRNKKFQENRIKIDGESKTENNSFATTQSDSESDGDDLIKVKRINHDVIDDEDDDPIIPEELLPIPRKAKLVTRTALAKKAMKKKMHVNEKRRFDDEGNEIGDDRKEMQSELAKKYAGENTNGGIDIEVSKKLITEEDKYDKQRFRELIKQRHKQQKEKLKNRNKLDEESDAEDAESDYSDGGSDEESANSVDLSWLPDPSGNSNARDDKSEQITETTAEHDEVSSASESNNTDEFEEPIKKKKKLTSKLTLEDAELIASQLLAQST